MSVINKMLQELDRRQAAGNAGPVVASPQSVRAVDPTGRGREWFWRIVATLMLAIVAWAGWVGYQLWPRPVATELAFKAAEQARLRSTAIATAPQVQASAAAVPAVQEKPTAVQEKPAVVQEKPAVTIAQPAIEQVMPAVPADKPAPAIAVQADTLAKAPELTKPAPVTEKAKQPSERAQQSPKLTESRVERAPKKPAGNIAP